ncbi:MAG: PilZ domain-containing protein, partial [Chromatiales bacterium]|nr:PilZ domain-containing protein [Chromatiales bacterium]
IYLDIVADGVEKKGLVDEKLSTHLSTLRELNFQSNHLLATIRKSNPEFAQYLALLDKKINIMTRIVSMENIGADVEPNMKVNISSSGLAFKSDTTYSKGRILSVYMVLFPNYIVISCQVKVVYCQVEGDRLRVAVEFLDLDPSARELLIRHLIEKQSEQLRSVRGTDS